MLQVHSMILWAKAKKEELKITVDQAYALVMALKDFGEELSPNHLTAMRKKDSKPFDYTYETLEELIRKGVNKEGKTIFADLGYTVSFFSSLIEKNSAGISLHVGTTNPMFNNNLVVNLPQTFPIYTDPITAGRLISLFKKCVEIFDPFWGCIGNSVNVRRYDGYWGDTLPTAIHWVNYFGSDVSKTFGDAKITSSPTYAKEKFHSGYFLVLKDGPINDEAEDDIKLQQRANKYFGL